jgi:predicted lipid-binding transport protein (Tim44 family)
MATSMGSAPQQTDPDRPGDQAGERFTGGEKSRFTGLIIAGLLLGAAVIAVAWIILGSEYAIPLVILAFVGLIVMLGFRLISSRNRDPSDNTEGGLPAQQPDPTRPLGDTAEAHDEINPHDFPLYNPGRHAAERLSTGAGNTTRGMDAGGAAGKGGPNEGEHGLVGPDEAGGADSGKTRGVSGH